MESICISRGLRVHTAALRDPNQLLKLRLSYMELAYVDVTRVHIAPNCTIHIVAMAWSGTGTISNGCDITVKEQKQDHERSSTMRVEGGEK